MNVGMNWHHPDVGGEFDWLAIDKSGCVGMLSTAGFGPVPRTATENREFLIDVLDSLMSLPVVGEAKIIGDPGASSDWWEVARRGLYCFDWDHSLKRYSLMAVPEHAVHVDRIVEHRITSVARKAQFLFRFADVALIEPDAAMRED